VGETLKKILMWTRFANISKLKEVLEKELDDNQKKLAFENSDGENGLKELSTISGVPYATVGSWWQKWFRLGLVVESETRKGRMMKIASLDDIGIKSPQRKEQKAKPQKESVSEKGGTDDQQTGDEAPP